MSATTHDAKSVTTQDELITKLRDLRRGDRVLFGDRSQPLTVVDLGERTITDERIDKTITTPLVRVRGDWSGAVDRVLAHKIRRYDPGSDQIRLKELDAIVVCESDQLKRGETMDVVRVGRSEVEA